MASQSAVEIAAPSAEAAIGLGLGLGFGYGYGYGMPVVAGGGVVGREREEEGEDKTEADINSRMKNLVQRRSRRLNEQYQQLELELHQVIKQQRLSKYRFVRRGSTDTEFARIRGQEATGVDVGGDGDSGSGGVDSAPPSVFRPMGLPRHRINNRIGRKPTGDHKQNQTGNGGAGATGAVSAAVAAAAGPASGHVLRSRYKLVRRRSCSETTPQQASD